MATNLFTDPDDFHTLYPDAAAEIDSAATFLRTAHEYSAPGYAAELGEHLLRAEGATMRARGLLMSALGPATDARSLLVMVRLIVEAVAHSLPPSLPEDKRREITRARAEEEARQQP